MRKAILAIMIAAFTAPAMAVELLVTPEPVLRAAFQVVLVDTKEETGEAVVLNFNTDQAIRVKLEPEDGRLVSPSIHVQRECDLPAGDYSLVANPGDMLVISTDLGGGLSKTIQVNPPAPTAAVLQLLRQGDDGWNKKSELRPGRYALVVTDPDQDTTCNPDEVKVEISSPAGSLTAVLAETGPATGEFRTEFEFGFREEGCSVTGELSLPSEKLALGLGDEVRFAYAEDTGGKYLTARACAVEIALLVSLSGAGEKAMDIPADVGQTVYVCVLKPAPLNQVIWCLGGERLLETSPQISLSFDEPGTYQLTALARQGDCWGQADVSLEVVAQTAIRLYDETGEEVDPEKPYPHTAMLFVQIENASDDPNPEVWIGKLGPDCKPTKLAVEELELGVYRGHFIPNGIGAQPGDVIWAFYRDPDSLEDFAWLTLPLR